MEPNQYHINMALLSLFLLSALYLNSCESQYNSNYNTLQEEGKQPRSEGEPQPPFYSISSSYLTHLAKTEVELHEMILKYSQALEERLVVINEYLQDYKESVTKGASGAADPWEKASEVAAHPIMAYRMIRRFVTEFDAVGTHLSQGLEIQLANHVIKLSSETYPWPSQKDLGDAMDALLRLHYVYDLDTEKFARGNIMGIQTEVGLTASNTVDLAEYAVNKEFYTLAMDWLKATETLMREDNDTSRSVNGIKITNIYKENIEKHDRDFDKNKENAHKYMFTERLSENPDAASLRSVNYEKFTRGVSKPENSEASNHYNFLALCNGDDIQSPSPRYEANLKCWYDKRNPYFTLFPLKAELLNHEPMLILFHDVISNQWTKDFTIKDLPILEVAPPGDADSTGMYTWLKDEQIPSTPIARRVELITGLHVRGLEASPPLQIASYAFGGYITIHLDAHEENKPNVKSRGSDCNRIASFLGYLNEVEKGGLTAFPELGIYVKPKKGSALLWYNYLKNGKTDTKMLHGSCPVVLGNKWSASKWIYQNANILRRLCDPNKEI